MESTFDSFSLLGYIGEETDDSRNRWNEHCPFCMIRLVSKGFDPQYHFSSAYGSRRVSHCTQCGWWGFSESYDSCNTLHVNHFSGILQSFDLKSASVPVDVLELELPKWIDKIGHLNPKRMEDIVRRILVNVWKCDVRHVGYSRDGGTDLLILNGDQSIAVQVKRRSAQWRGEVVSGVREFLGAALLSGHRRLMYVTTAERFTKGAVEAADISTERKLVESFELVSMKEIRAFLPAMPNVNPWDFAVKRANDQICAVPKIPNPYRLIEPAFPFA